MRLADYYWANVREVQGCKCLMWTGLYSSNDLPLAEIDGQLTSARALAWVVDGGLLSDGPFISTCRTLGCVAVDHIRMKSEDPLLDDNRYSERLEEGFRLLGQGEDDIEDEE